MKETKSKKNNISRAKKFTYHNISKKLISDEILKKHLFDLLSKTNKVIQTREFEKNVIDPFAQIFESIIFNQEHSNWKNSEVLRQNQKSLQNFIGEFHQNILCELDGCYRPKEGVDFICDEKKIK